MPLRIQPVELADFDTMIDHASRFSPGDDLVAAPTTLAWLVSTQTEALERLQWHMRKQRARFLADSSARFMKVVDVPDNGQDGDIISIARWHWYPEGYSYAKERHWEVDEMPPSEHWPPSMNIKLHDFVFSERDGRRETWMEQNKPCWILTHLVTRLSQRNRGAAGMLMEWGLEQADESGAIAYLEAGILAIPVYSKYGFQQIGDLVSLDLRPYGSELPFKMARMARFPQHKRPS